MDLPLPDTAYSIEFDEEGPDGHAFGRPPGLHPGQWPRSRAVGLPMPHLFTVRVPEQYRCAGPDLAGLSVFQAGDDRADPVDGVADTIAGGEPPSDTAFWSALTEYARSRHPEERYQTDDIAGGWAWIWLTEAELAGPPCPLPDPATRLEGTEDTTDAWRADRPPRRLRLVARVDDPNVGKTYVEFDKTSGYIDMFSEEGKRLGLVERFFYQQHFGGTIVPPNGGEDIGPFFLAFDEKLGDPNLGGDGMAQLDLATEYLQWSCG
ncbi:hypothetical protein [Lentzea sp. NBRC 105346]|uniref:hypothetical protein n=1 Tax=Lentzea sp. NBRC 105346 TaxID=3032205 RepID=UPI002557C5C2|nr:hypothetical protein [Lentzea sp. NBRC 105346]